MSKELDHAFYNRPCNFLKSEYKPIIPCVIYQTWYTKDLPSKMRERVELLKSQNPGFKHCLFDDNDCREFIKKHFRPDVLDAYNRLIPGAYKADLWRLCVLFINGGIYLDIKLTCINGFKLIELTENNHFVKDRTHITKNGIYNTLISSVAGNPFLLRAIQRIVFNVQNKFYGWDPLCPTGPNLLGSVAIRNKFVGVNLDLFHYQNGGYIIYKNRFIISTEYPEYNDERTNTYNSINTKRYDALWDERRIYA
jgi:mannosyltransferase OCH1-like enzyme